MTKGFKEDLAENEGRGNGKIYSKCAWRARAALIFDLVHWRIR